MIDFDKLGYRQVLPEDSFHYDCSCCGDCCRDVKDSVLVESLDLFRLARFLGMETGEVARKYTDTTYIAWGFPVLMLKTKPYRDACVFLKSSRCSVHDAKPRVCHLYPLGIGPDDENPGSWLSFIVSKNPDHLSGQRRRVGDWVDANFSAEDRTFVAADYLSTGELAKRVQRIDRRYEDEVV